MHRGYTDCKLSRNHNDLYLLRRWVRAQHATNPSGRLSFPRGALSAATPQRKALSGNITPKLRAMVGSTHRVPIWQEPYPLLHCAQYTMRLNNILLLSIKVCRNHHFLDFNQNEVIHFRSSYVIFSFPTCSVTGLIK